MKTCNDCIHRSICYWAKSKLSACADKCEDFKAEKTGHWIKEETIYGWDNKSYQCSVCGRSIHLDPLVEDLEDYPYCHCGAKMEREEQA